MLLRTLCVAVGLLLAIIDAPARAVPSFAAQTGQPCSTCHIGAFGPQLTPFGREFKIEGYTMTGGEGLASRIPLAAMALGSFTHTKTAQPEPPHDFGTNNNFAFDQVSLFFAGRSPTLLVPSSKAPILAPIVRSAGQHRYSLHDANTAVNRFDGATGRCVDQQWPHRSGPI